MIIELCSPDGTALLQTPSRAVQGFVTSIFEAVPAGCESSHVSIDDAGQPAPRRLNETRSPELSIFCGHVRHSGVASVATDT